MGSTADVEGLRSSLDLVDIVGRYVQLKQEGAEFRALCPFHEDHHPSLTVNRTKQVWACFACGAHETFGADVFGFVRSYEQCTFPEAIAKLQNGSGGNGAKPPIREPLKKPPLRRTFPHPDGEQPDMTHRDFGEPIKVWTIRERDGRAYFYEARYDSPAGKQTRFWTWGQHTSEPARWECRHPSNPRPFFGLEELDKRPEAQVMIHEAPKKAEAARALFPAQVHLAIVGGAHQVPNMQIEPIAGRRAILLPDNDEAGRTAMKRLAVRLWDAGAAEVKGIDPETLPDGSVAPASWDIADAVGWTADVALQWAKARRMDYPRPEPIAAPDASTASDLPPSTAPAPEAATPQDAPGAIGSIQPPTERKKAKPRLAAIDGGAVRKPWAEVEPEVDQLPAFSEFALARRFVDTQGQDWRHTAAWSAWFKWDGTRWCEDVKKAWTWAGKECCAAAMFEHANESTPSQRMKVTTLKTVGAIMGLAAADPLVAVAPDVWDADPMLLGTPAGVVDLRTGALAAAQREQMISKRTSVSPVLGEHPWWDRVLERGHKGNPELAGLLHRWCGYMLTGDTREERFLFIHGPGASGKSKFLGPLAEIMGDYRRAAKMESFTARDRTEHSEEIARLAGARLVTAVETEEGSRWNESRITALTGRDTIAARHMHKSTFEYLPQFKLVFVGNHRPALRSVGEEMRRRIDLIEWSGTIPEADRVLDLPDKLRAEYPAILAWMIQGCLLWQSEGLGKPRAVEDATREYLSAEDTLGGWLEACAIVESASSCPSTSAYLSFKRWAEQAGEYVPSQKRFSQRLVERGFQTKRTSAQRLFVGLRLKTTDNFEPDPGAWLPPD